ncbi:MAG: hypothetical protein ABI370_09890 [Gammaproteobacteria bacterium]
MGVGYEGYQVERRPWILDDRIGKLNTHATGGFNTGIGVEIPLTKQISARLEYDYIDYSSFNNNGTTGSKNTLADNRGSLDMVYHFNN